MDSFISGIKENKKLIIITLIVIIIVIVIALYNNLKPKPQYDPEVNEYNEVNYIKKNYKVNEYSVVNISELDLLNAYLKKYITLAVTKPEEAFNMLSKESKESFNNSVDEYKKYVESITSIYTKDNQVVKYRKGDGKGNTEIVDSESNKYIITEHSTWDIEITLNGRE